MESESTRLKRSSRCPWLSAGGGSGRGVDPPGLRVRGRAVRHYLINGKWPTRRMEVWKAVVRVVVVESQKGFVDGVEIIHCLVKEKSRCSAWGEAAFSKGLTCGVTLVADCEGGGLEGVGSSV